MRKIIHIDMDCFYAAIEVRDNPSLRGHPVAVGGVGNRAVVATCNYEARKFGVHSALPMKTALRLCPQLQVVKVNMDKYREASCLIRDIFHQYTDRVEPLSLDEAYLDVSGSEANAGSATLMAHQIRTQIYEATGLTASAGIGPNKLIAKIASDWRKPNGQFTVPPQHASSFIAQLPIEKLWGIGKVSRQKLNDRGIFVVNQLTEFTLEQMIQQFGQYGLQLFDMVRGIDHREVNAVSRVRSVSVENTFENDLLTQQQKSDAIDQLVFQLMERLEKNQLLPRVKKCSLKLRNHHFKTHRAEITTGCFHSESFQMLFHKLNHKDQSPVRLIGVGVSIVDADQFAAELPFVEQIVDEIVEEI